MANRERPIAGRYVSYARALAALDRPPLALEIDGTEPRIRFMPRARSGEYRWAIVLFDANDPLKDAIDPETGEIHE